jgi:hypothetical protein
MRAALSFDAEGMSVFYVLTAADFSWQFLVQLLERKNTNVFENAIEISKEIMQSTEISIGLFCMDQESHQNSTMNKMTNEDGIIKVDEVEIDVLFDPFHIQKSIGVQIIDNLVAGVDTAL